MNHFRGIALCVGLAAAVTFSACSDDTVLPPDGPHIQQFQDLTERWHVLNNFELAHNKRRTDKYDQLIDVNYTFFFDTVKNGSLTTIQWGRADDVAITSALLQFVDKLELDLVNLDKPVWTEMTVPYNGGETWYITTLYYSFVVKLGSTTLTSVSPAQMSFTVRNAGTTTKPHWQLVELRDLAHLSAPPPSVASVALHVNETTYGKMKSGM